MSIETHGKYKTFGDFKYHLNFPDEWILNEKPDTGRQCWNCVGKYDNKGYAMWRGIVLGYCSNCAEDYEGERGRGFYSFGVEYNGNHHFPSAFDLYLGPIDFENYGDFADNEDDTMKNRLKYLNEHTADYKEDDDGKYEDMNLWELTQELLSSALARQQEDEYYETEEEYYSDEDDFGECLQIGCGKQSVSYSAYCRVHFEKYDR